MVLTKFDTIDTKVLVTGRRSASVIATASLVLCTSLNDAVLPRVVYFKKSIAAGPHRRNKFEWSFRGSFQIILWILVEPMQTASYPSEMIKSWSSSSCSPTLSLLLLSRLSRNTVRFRCKVGAALSMCYKTGQPILFVGTGQKYTHLRRLNVNYVIKALFG